MKAHKMRFDTHQYVKKAKAAGFTEQQAEFQAEEMYRLVWDNLDNRLDQMVTKEEFYLYKEEFCLYKEEFNQAKEEFNNRLNQMVTREEFKYELSMVHKDIAVVDTKLTWLVSLFGLVSILVSVVGFLHQFHLI